MCTIVDAQVSHEVFGANPSPAGAQFFLWINQGKGRLVAGGKLFKELLNGGDGFRRWAQQAELAGRLKILNYADVNKRTAEIKAKEKIESDDPHVLAVARISGARLLYSNDRDLHKDFANKKLIDGPRGKIYSTLKNRQMTPTHSRLLSSSFCKSLTV